MRALLIAEGSGGHLIPALQTAQALARAGVRVQLWYASRRQTAPLAEAVAQEASDASIELHPLEGHGSTGTLGRCVAWWQEAQRCLQVFAPDVVVGFGGWVSMPVLVAARMHRVPSVLHEQNVVMGRANRWLSRWVDRVAVSFRATPAAVRRPVVVTGLPVRPRIGRVARSESLRHFGWQPDRPTLLVLGGSQGARPLNRLMRDLLPQLSERERATWQFVHITGHADEETVRAAYAAHQMTAWVAPFFSAMELAYAQADLVVSRAGASTIAELARCGLPAIFIPYPHAGGHQLVNARIAESAGAGLVIEESRATPERLLRDLRRLLDDREVRQRMGRRMRVLDHPEAAERLRDVVLDAARLAAAPGTMRSAGIGAGTMAARAADEASVAAAGASPC